MSSNKSLLSTIYLLTYSTIWTFKQRAFNKFATCKCIQEGCFTKQMRITKSSNIRRCSSLSYTSLRALDDTNFFQRFQSCISVELMLTNSISHGCNFVISKIRLGIAKHGYDSITRKLCMKFR